MRRKTENSSGVPVHAVLFVSALILIFCGMLVLNVLTPLQADDYDYSFSWDTGKPLAGFMDILRSQVAHYRLWGGRSVTHTLTQIFLYLGKPLFNVVSALMYVLLLLEILRLGGRKLRRAPTTSLLAVHVCLFFFLPFFGVVFLWLDGACNYLFGTALALLPLLMGKSRLTGGFFNRKKVLPLMWLLFFIGGWTNENTAVGILVTGVLLFLNEWKRRGKMDKAWLAGLVLEAAGVALLLLAPGNRERAGAYATGNVLMEYGKRTVYVLYYALRYCGILWIPLVILLLLNRKHAPFSLNRLSCAVAAAVATLALIASPEVSDRTYLGPFVLLLAQCLSEVRMALHEAENRPVYVPALFAALTLGMFFLAGNDVSEHARSWQGQLDRISQAQEAGQSTVTLASVPSRSRYTMTIQIEPDPAAWPNSTLGKWCGIAI
ncbi:MAG: hypothetical protein IJ088_16405, partial [Clostridia bacterium]|nr:hypothetical protein [Clostridia bacterium]